MIPTHETRSIAELHQALRAGARAKYLFFWSHRPSRPGAVDRACFSQWYTAPFQASGVTYATAEHWMMAEKARLFGDQGAEAAILRAGSPGAAKALGREVRGFDDTTWAAARFEIVVRGNVLKFGQHPELQTFLVQTGKRVLVEASPRDRVWGIGLPEDHPNATRPLAWRGLNLLGFALMEARARLQ